MTHVKNVEAFTRLIGFCTGYGAKYNPGSSNLRIESLTPKLNSAKEAMALVAAMKSLHEQEVNTRKQIFESIDDIASGILLTMDSSGATPEMLSDARYFVRQIKGYKIYDRAPIPSPEVQKVKRKSILQLAYVSKADWFSKLVQTIDREPLYKPNEAALSKSNLIAKVAELNASMEAVNLARVNWSNALIERNKVLYNPNQSLFTLMRAVKQYVKAIFGHTSAEYGQIKTLGFIKVTRA